MHKVVIMNIFKTEMIKTKPIILIFLFRKTRRYKILEEHVSKSLSNGNAVLLKLDNLFMVFILLCFITHI